MEKERKQRDRPWDKTPAAAAYRAAYHREHYTRISATVDKATGKAYRDACKAAGIPISRPLMDAIADVLAGKYKPL